MFNIFPSLVTNPWANLKNSWATRYKEMLNYPSIILWVLEQVEMVANAFVVSFAATDVGMGVEVVGTLSTNIFGLIGPIAIVGLVTATIGAAITCYYSLTIVPWTLRI
jgi:hypothetical protein